LDVFLQIALRRRGPEDLPDSRFLVLVAGLVYVAVQGFLAVPVYGTPLALGQSLALDLVLLCGCLWGLLRLAGHAPRFRQTLTALFGTGAVLGLCMLPFTVWLDAAAAPGKPAVGPTIGLLAVVSWSLVVNGHIFSRALSAPFVAGLAIAVAYFFLNYLVFAQFGPSPA
ncbi:MAG: hypothetical protein ABI661_04280, partial [Gammaproteobacteria bacterium]